MKVTLIIPAYNAGRVVAGVIARIPPDVCDEIIVLDDGSDDNTFSVLSTIQGIHLLRNRGNRGYGSAQKTLYKTALEQGADIILLMHSDGGHFPEEIPQMLAPIIGEMAQVVVGSRIAGLVNSSLPIMGSRYLGVLRTAQMPPHLFIGHIFLMVIHNIAFGTRFHTWHSGFRAMTRQAVQSISLEDLNTGYLIDSEILLAAHLGNLQIAEVPVSTHYDQNPGSSVKPISFGFRAIRFTFANLIKLRALKRH